MSKRIGPDMVLYYALSKRNQISSDRLIRLHQCLVSQVQETLVDTTLCSIQTIVTEQKNLFKLSQSVKSYTLTKTQKNSIFFKIEFLDRCYEPFFDKNDFEKIKKILLSDD